MNAPPKAPPSLAAVVLPMTPTNGVGKPKVTLTAPRKSDGQIIAIYGPGGIGKTTLAAQAPGPVVFLDLDDSLRVLQIPGIQVVPDINDWAALRAALQAPGWESVKTLVIDSLSRAEDMAVAHVVATVPTDKGTPAKRIEDFGYGKGYRHLFDAFLRLLSDLESHKRAGRNVILIMHDTTTHCPNPYGDDWLRYEPRLYTSEKVQLRQRVRDFADHLFYVGYDVAVKDGKGAGSGTRTLWPVEYPHCMAKSRTLSAPVEITLDSTEFWKELLKCR